MVQTTFIITGTFEKGLDALRFEKKKEKKTMCSSEKIEASILYFVIFAGIIESPIKITGSFG